MSSEILPDPSDLALLGLTVAPDRHHARFLLTSGVARHDGALYGGAAVAVSVTAMEAATDRPGLWVTTQYVAQAALGDVIDCTTEVHASGGAIAQCQVTGRQGERVLFVSVGATATPRPGGLEGQYETMPDVSGPRDSGPLDLAPPIDRPAPDFVGFQSQVEFRVAEVLDPPEVAPPMALWARLRSPAAPTRAGIAFLADMVPPAIARAAGILGGGISLDNSLRFGAPTDDASWMLLELRGHMTHGSHGHGSVRVWAEDGRLLAVGGQSANMRFVFGPDPDRPGGGRGGTARPEAELDPARPAGG